MQKKTLSCLLLYFLMSLQDSIGQSFVNNNEGIWVSDDNYVVYIHPTKSSVYNRLGRYRDNLKVQFRKNDSVVLFIDNFQSYDGRFIPKPSKTMIFKLLGIGCDTLKLIPEDDFSKEFLETTNPIYFTRANTLLKEDLEIEKVLFYGQEDFFNYYLRIDKERNINVIKKYNGRENNTSTYYYKSQLEEYFFILLLNKIKISNLKNLDYKITTDCSSCDRKSLIVEFKDKTFKHENFGVSPIILEDLVAYLKSFSKTIKLEKTDEVYDFDKAFKFAY